MKTTLALLTALLLALLALPAAASELDQQFANPPAECSPGIFWYWLNGYVTEAGIDADLEAMKKAGIGNVMLFNIKQVHIEPNPVIQPVNVLSPEWRRLMKHAMQKADALGIKVNLYNSMEGWSSTGGPAITPELAMQKITWSEVKTDGGKRYTGKLPQPRVNLNTYRDIAVIAFPTPEAEVQPDPVPVITSDVPDFDPRKLSTHPIPSTGFASYCFDFLQSRADTALLKAVTEKNTDVRWIWFPEKGAQAGSAMTAPACTRYFRQTFTVAEQAEVKTASLAVTADNGCKVWINGEEVVEAPSGMWEKVRMCEIRKYLKAGKNVIAIEAENTESGPSGLLATVSVRAADGTTLRLVTDGKWQSSDSAAASWRDQSFQEEGWKPALEMAAHGQAPWGSVLQGNRRHIMLTYENPFAARSLRLYPAFRTPWISNVLATGEVQQSLDGVMWKTVRPFTLKAYTPLDITFSAPPARFWRIALSGEQELPLDELKLSDDYRIDHWTVKAIFSFIEQATVSRLDLGGDPAPASTVIQKERIIEISSKMNAAGDLDWEVPSGNWTIMRFGYTPTGSEIRPAGSGGQGLENDKLSRASLDAHWNQAIRPWLDDPETRALFDTVHIDSYEAGSQNWTEMMPEAFLKRNGYDIKLCLPILVGRVVESNLHSERFLWDFRRTITDLMTENYYGYFKKLCKGAGKKFSLEPYGEGPVNSFASGVASDLPITEHVGLMGGKLASSPAHLYGKPVVSVEAFTADPGAGGNWSTAFWDIKTWGDKYLCGGVNHFTYHVFNAQPFSDAIKPGLTLGSWGTHFNRGHTWWPEMPAFSAYHRRCSYLLQQGRFAADVLFFYGEGSPKNGAFWPPYPLPTGYDYDTCDLHALLNRITVKDGMLVTPDGISYRLLVVPNESDAMTPELVKRIGELVAAGANVMAPKPVRSPSLHRQPQDDAEVAKLAQVIWGDCDGVKSQSHLYGKGRILWGRTFEQTLADLNMSPALDISVKEGNENWGWIQRRLADGDLFFIASGFDQERVADFSFRTTGTTPRWLDPVTGKTRSLPDFEKKDGRVTLKLKFAPRQSGFVFFPDKPEKKLAAGGNIAYYKNLLTLEGSWTVSFDPAWGGPKSTVFETLQDWSKHPDDGIKYYSGRATYTKTFTLSAVSTEQTYFLDLGSVKNLANVSLNGIALGTIWCAPWHVEIKPKAGENLLEITVINLWVNRLIGDEKFDGSLKYDGDGNSHTFPPWVNSSVPRPETRFTYTVYNPWKAASPLRESGLLGPVAVQAEQQAQ